MKSKKLWVVPVCALASGLIASGVARAQECLGECSLSGDPCTVNSDCPAGQTCDYVTGDFSISLSGGQVNMAGATLFFDFFLLPASTNDWNDVDDDGVSGGPFPIDQLAPSPFDPGSPPAQHHWMFNYRSVGSVRGFEEFVEGELCGAIPRQIPAEGGLFNTIKYADAGFLVGPWTDRANHSGTPYEQCEIEGSFLDVPGEWAVQVGGTPNWDRSPSEPGYGLNPIPSSSGFVSNLQTLSRDCGSCTVTGEPCARDDNCPQFYVTQCSGDASACNSDADCLGTCSGSPGISCAVDADCGPNGPCLGFAGSCEPLETCDTSGGFTASLNTNTASPDADTIFSEVAAWVAVSVIANRGADIENVSYSQIQHLNVAGRMPNGENLVGATRDVGSGTRNAWMNSFGIDTSWGRGDNTGDRANNSAQTNLGPVHQATNCGGSSIVENAVRNRRLAIGHTGTSGAGRSVADAKAGQYEILGVWQDVNPDCAGVPTYVRPTVNSILDNCGCDGYKISGSGSFVVRGNRHTNRHGRCTISRDICVEDAECPVGETCDDIDPLYVPGAPGEKIDNQQVAEYLNNIFDSAESFAGSVEPGECFTSLACSGNNTVDCTSDADCVGIGTCTAPRPCTIDGDCDAGDDCRLSFNMPGQLLVQNFFLPVGIDCIHDLTSPLDYFGFCSDDASQCEENADCASNLCLKPRNQLVQDFMRANNDLGVGAQPDGSDYEYGANSVGGKVPIRQALPVAGITNYSDGSITGSYCRPGGGPPVTSSENVTLRDQVQGDMDNDKARTPADVPGLVSAYYGPRAWSNANGSIAELIADFNGDGSLTKEDLRYWADGLHLVAGSLDRKAGAIAVDTAIAGLGKPYPWADTRIQIITPAAGCGSEPGYPAPAAISGLLATGAAYEAGDFRGDVAGGSPNPGDNPKGWDGRVDAADIDYVCSNFGSWSDLDQAVFIDLSADMDGDLDVDMDDVTELVEEILETTCGDADLDGDVDAADDAIVTAGLTDPCNQDSSCSWAQGDFNCDGQVTAADQSCAVGVEISTWSSCANHGAAGVLCGPPNPPGVPGPVTPVVEPRDGGGLFSIDMTAATTAASASADCGSGPIAPNSVTQGDPLVVDFTFDLPNGCCTITLGGDATGTFDVVILRGDADVNGFVNGADVTAVKPKLGTVPTSGPTAFIDVDSNGNINGADVTFIKPRLGGAAAACP